MIGIQISLKKDYVFRFQSNRCWITKDNWSSSRGSQAGKKIYFGEFPNVFWRFSVNALKHLMQKTSVPECLLFLFADMGGFLRMVCNNFCLPSSNSFISFVFIKIIDELFDNKIIDALLNLKKNQNTTTTIPTETSGDSQGEHQLFPFSISLILPPFNVRKKKWARKPKHFGDLFQDNRLFVVQKNFSLRLFILWLLHSFRLAEKKNHCKQIIHHQSFVFNEWNCCSLTPLNWTHTFLKTNLLAFPSCLIASMASLTTLLLQLFSVGEKL